MTSFTSVETIRGYSTATPDVLTARCVLQNKQNKTSQSVELIRGHSIQRCQTGPRSTLLVHARQLVSNAIGGYFTRGMAHVLSSLGVNTSGLMR
jgi:hypothetical protein